MIKALLLVPVLFTISAFAGTPAVSQGTSEYVQPTHSESYLTVDGASAKALAVELGAKSGKTIKIRAAVTCNLDVEGQESCEISPVFNYKKGGGVGVGQ